MVAAAEQVRPVVERLERLGYEWRGDLGVAGREAFFTPERTGLPRHHLYVVVEDQTAHLNHWLFRELLREDAPARDHYAELKRRNAELAAGNMDVYVAAKARFVAEVLTRARREHGLSAAEYWDRGPLPGA